MRLALNPAFDHVIDGTKSAGSAKSRPRLALSGGVPTALVTVMPFECLPSDSPPPRCSDILQQRVMVAETVNSYPMTQSAKSLMPVEYSSYSVKEDAGESHSCRDSSSAQHPKKDLFSLRKQREFIPDSKKDNFYWDRRRRNNEAAKRSREKRKFNDMILEQRVIELTKENHILRTQLTLYKDKFGIQGDSLMNPEQVLSNLPQNDQLLALNKRSKMNQAFLSLANSPSVTSLLTSGGLCQSGSPRRKSPSSLYPYQASSEPSYDSAPYSASDYRDAPYYPTQEQQDREASSNQSFSSGEQESYYDQDALNLSFRCNSQSFHESSSPPEGHMDYGYCGTPPLRQSRSFESSASLPHKLRHKARIGDLAAQLTLTGIKSEPRDSIQEADDSDERDSGISQCSPSPNRELLSGPVGFSLSSKFMGGKCSDDPEPEGSNLSSQVQQLASEVASLKNLLVSASSGRSDPSGGSELDDEGPR